MARRRSDDVAKRLIALLGRLRPGSTLSLAALAEELGVTPAELAGDITTLSLCGVAPYDPFGLVPVWVDGDSVRVFGDIPALRGPVRLSASEAEALAAALQAAGFDAADPLTARLLKAATSGFEARELEHIVRTKTSGHETHVYRTLARAVAERLPVRLQYTSAGSTSPAWREVEPLVLFAERGEWYLTAWCRRVRAWRTFRLDRASGPSVVEGPSFTPREGAPSLIAAFDPHGLPVARLRFAAEAEFSEREWPGADASETRADGSVVVEVPYAGTEWIARMVVSRLGAVEVLEPAQVRAAVFELATALLRDS